MTLHPDAVCKECFKDYELPRGNWLDFIYQQQIVLQNFICKKRNGLQVPKIDNITQEHVYESLYHYACMMMEYRELMTAPNDIERDFEYIDVLFFLCNIGIYAGIKNVKLLDFNNLSFISTDSFSMQILKFLDLLPFKKWKTYKPEDFQLTDEQKETYNLALNLWICYGLRYFDYTEKYIFSLYMSKLTENKNRQIIKDRGYIG